MKFWSWKVQQRKKNSFRGDQNILWPPDVKSQLIGKDSDGGKDWRQKEQRVRWLHSIISAMDMSLRKLWEIVKDREACCAE